MTFRIIFACLMIPSAALAEWCDPPVAPPPTSEALARDFYVEFRAEFEAYFSAVTEYVSCLDRERERILLEANETVQRYDRFLSDAEGWDLPE